jgi:hypothetical protein
MALEAVWKGGVENYMWREELSVFENAMTG